MQTRILVTHGLTHLPDCDRIIVMHEGQIIESGTYDELMVKDGKLKEIMKSQENASSEGIPVILCSYYKKIHLKLVYLKISSDQSVFLFDIYISTNKIHLLIKKPCA